MVEKYLNILYVILGDIIYAVMTCLGQFLNRPLFQRITSDLIPLSMTS
jgi:hypothetical protein